MNTRREIKIAFVVGEIQFIFTKCLETDTFYKEERVSNLCEGVVVKEKDVPSYVLEAFKVLQSLKED